MTSLSWKEHVKNVDSRRNWVVPGDRDQTIEYCVQHFLSTAQEAIEQRGAFFVALSGGSTPKAIFSRLTHFLDDIDWSRVFLFWSDERHVAPSDENSNYKMAMDAGFAKLPVPKANTFRMKAETELETNAMTYQQDIQDFVEDGAFDLIMLGMGEDGHTASLFPGTQAVEEEQEWVVANYVPEKESWRMTFTYPLINRARQAVFYVLGSSKATMLKQVLQSPGGSTTLPASAVGTKEKPALWICDRDAAAQLQK